MRRTGIIILTLATLWLAGCGGMPLEVEQAMRQQAAELEQIRKAHRAGVDVLFARIRQLQLFILAEKEHALRGKYARGPRDHFGKDLLNTFGAFMTTCRVKKNDAEKRITSMRSKDWKPEKIGDLVKRSDSASETDESWDLEEDGLDGIAKLILAKFKGHGLTRLVEAILKAQGYTTWRSPEGADGGVDILAGAGPLGFGTPRLCVEVKSEAAPIDRPTVDKLLGAVQKFGAQEGLFISWSGFKSTVQKELASSFFSVRLWTQKELLEALFLVYDKLDEHIKAEIPLKRIWTVAIPEEE